MPAQLTAVNPDPINRPAVAAPLSADERAELEDLRAFARFVQIRWAGLESQIADIGSDIADVKSKILPAMDKLNAEGIMGIFSGALGRRR